MKLTGAEIVLACLKDEGVEFLFGYPGGAALHIYDAVYQQEQVRHILVRHEQGATHAADGFARATGKPGVVLVTSGPGVTNTVTGSATAYMDSIPMVVLTAQVPTHLIGDDAFQEVDTVGITRPCVKHNFLVKDVNELAMTIKKAFYIATTGRPGPVVVDIPKDVTAARAEYQYPKSIEMRSYAPVQKGHSKQISRAVDLLLQAERPIIYTGGGVIHGSAASELCELVRELKYPCTNTLMGLGAFPASDPLFIGMLGKNVSVEVPIVGEAAPVLREMVALIHQQKDKLVSGGIDAWWNTINAWRGVDCLNYDASDELIKPQYVVQKLFEITKGEAFVASDVGQHQMWAAQYYGFDQPRRWVNSGGLGTMGFGLPAAMGIQLAYPKMPVACITGEASIMMCIQELSTCKQYDLPIKVIALNNRYMGMVRQWQEFFYESRYSHSYMDALPDFVRLAESFGHVGMRIDQPGDVEGALKEAFDSNDRLVFMDFITDQTENVYPMIAAGAGHNEMHLKPSPHGEIHEERELA